VPATIKERVKVFFAQTAPLIEYYTKIGKLTEVNGEGEMVAVRKKILDAIKKGKPGRK
jgi:adenylate kinase